MGSLSTGLKKFLQNKNTVTIVGVVLAIFVLYFMLNTYHSKFHNFHNRNTSFYAAHFRIQYFCLQLQ